MFLEFVQYLVYYSSVVREVGRGSDEDVVHVDYYFPCCREVAEDGIHHGLERARGVR